MTNHFNSEMESAQLLSALDVESLKILQHLVGDEFSSVIRRYLSDGEMTIRQMDAAFKSVSLTSLHQLAHTFKGSSGTLSANRLYDICDELERAALVGSSHRVLAQLLNTIDSEFQNVKNALLHYLELYCAETACPKTITEPALP